MLNIPGTLNKFFYPDIPISEYERRHILIEERMDSEGVDCLVFFGGRDNYSPNPESRWITGLNDRHFFMIVFLRKGISTIFTKSQRALENIKKRTIFKDIRLTESSYEKILIDHLREINLEQGKIGFLKKRSEFQYPKLDFKEIETGLPKINIKLDLNNFSDLMSQKSSTELVFYRYGAKCTDIAAENYIQQVKPNMTENELYGELYKSGYNSGGITELCAVSINSTLEDYTEPLINPSLKKLSKKSFILNQLSVSYGNCPGYILFPYLLGTTDPFIKELLTLYTDINAEIIPLIKPGRTINDILKEARKLSTSKLEITEFIAEGRNHFNSQMEFSGELMENQLIIVQPRGSIDTKEMPPLIGSLYVVTEEGGKEFQKLKPTVQ